MVQTIALVDDDRNIVWTEERYNKLNTYILIPKDLFKQNYKNWGLVLEGKDYWKRIIQKTHGNLISVSPYYKYPQKFFDAVKSYNFKKVQLRSKNIFSINTNSGFITHLEVLTDEGVNLQKAQYLNDGDSFSFMYKKNSIKKLYIDTYLNTNIIAHRYYDWYTDVSQINRKQSIVIDLEKSLITEEFNDGHIVKTICKPLSFSSNDTQEAKSSSGSAFFINNKGNLTYTLSGICIHGGGLHGGHYYAMCKDHIKNKWRVHNDTHVTDTTLENVLSQTPYCLFYIKKG